jgi:putative phage-type endonuclease
MAKIFHSTTKMDRPEWLELRNNGIGGSDAAVILGLNKWKTPFELWLEKTGQIENKELYEVDEDGAFVSGNEAAYWGNLDEDQVAKEFALRTKKKVRKRNAIFQHDEHPFLLANIDREIVGEDAGLECKITSAYNSKEWEDEEIPESYIIQCQHYMNVMNKQSWYIACKVGGNKLVHKIIQRDQELIDIIQKEQIHFWEYHVKQKIAPALDGSSAAEKFLKERFKETDKDKVIDLGSEYGDKIKHYLDLKEHYKAIEKDINEVENQLKYELKEAETGFIHNYRVNWKLVVSNRVDSKRLKVEFPDIHAQVLNESYSRRFEIKEIK